MAKGLETSVPSPTWIPDEPEDVPLPELPGEVRRGTLHAVQGEGDEAAGFDAGTDGAPAAPDYEKAAVAGVQGVEWRDESGTIHSLPCSAVLLDYNAWETRTRRPWDDIGLSDSADGFVRIDPWCETATPGVFAAGDITGRYRSTAMALGDGVNAGLSAVRYTYRIKFEYEPNLFAYQSQDRVLSTEESDLPAIPDDARVVPIGHESAVSSIARTHGLSVDDAPVDSAVTFATLVQRCDADRARAVALVDAWMDAKVVAVHRRRWFHVRDVLLTAMSAPRIEDETIAALAAWQADRMPGYRALFERRGFSPDTMQHWLEIPGGLHACLCATPCLPGARLPMSSEHPAPPAPPLDRSFQQTASM